MLIAWKINNQWNLIKILISGNRFCNQWINELGVLKNRTIYAKLNIISAQMHTKRKPSINSMFSNWSPISSDTKNRFNGRNHGRVWKPIFYHKLAWNLPSSIQSTLNISQNPYQHFETSNVAIQVRGKFCAISYKSAVDHTLKAIIVNWTIF